MNRFPERSKNRKRRSSVRESALDPSMAPSIQNGDWGSGAGVRVWARPADLPVAVPTGRQGRQALKHLRYSSVIVGCEWLIAKGGVGCKLRNPSPQSGL